MAIITYPLNGITYNAEDAQTYLAGRTSGVYSIENNFLVTVSGSSRDVTIWPGLAWINNANFSGKSVCMTQPETVSIPIAHSSLPRIDLIVLRFNKNQNSTTLEVVAGTPAAAPVPPDVTQNELVYELGLYTVKVGAGSVLVLQSDITSVMNDETYCGISYDLAGKAMVEAMLAEKQDMPVVVDNTSSVVSLTLADNTEYRLKSVTQLTIKFPSGNFESWISLTAGNNISVVFPTTAKYIGDLPAWSAGGTYEISVKDGVVIAGSVKDEANG